MADLKASKADNLFVTVSIALLFIFTSCGVKKISQPNYNQFEWVEHGLPKKLLIDTIDAYFLYEEYIQSYIWNDVFLKKGGFIRFSDVSLEAYKSGYFVSNTRFLKVYERELSPFVDMKSVVELDSLLLSIKMNEDYKIGTVNPYCNLYYRKIPLKIIVLNLGLIKSIIPFFGDCVSYSNFEKKNKMRGYQYGKIKAYLILKVI